MPTNTNAYNSRVTDEALEKRFRDTFRSQGGAELVDDLYAQGVIVPVVDFTQAATGDVLPQNLQTAWDFTTGAAEIRGETNTVLIGNSGFWKIDVVASVRQPSVDVSGTLNIFDGTTSKAIWGFSLDAGSAGNTSSIAEQEFVVFLRSNDFLRGTSTDNTVILDVWYRQIADVNGNLIDPQGFTFS